MVIERSKNAVRNVFWGLSNKLIRLLAQFVIRMIIIKCLGEVYLGLDSLFTSVLSMLSLAELGIGTALVFNMYKAIAEDDSQMICALMLFYKKCYRIIGFIVLGLGLFVFPFVPKLVGGDCPENLNVYVIYAINLIGTLSTYFLFAYRNCLLDAFQRSDITSKVEMICGVGQYAAQIVLLILLKNYYVYLVIVPCCKFFQNILTAVVVKKKYPKYQPIGILSKEIKRKTFIKVKALITYKIGNVVSNSVDNIVISIFCGLAVLGKYGNYYYVITTLFTLLQIYYNAIIAGIGNSVVVSSIEKNYSNFKVLLFMQIVICGFCATALLVLYQDFIALWVGNNMLFDFNVVICFVVYFYVWKIQDVVCVYKDALGMWERDRWRPLISALCNLCLNLVSVKFFGIYGIILSTVFCCAFIDNPWGAIVLFKGYFNKNVTGYFLRLIFYSFFNIVACIICYYICCFINIGKSTAFYVVLELVIKGIICFIIYSLLVIITFFKTLEFKLFVGKIQKMIKKNK